MQAIETNGQQIAYLNEGEGDAILFIQGVGVVAEGWRPQIDALKDRYRCISVDNRGIGDSLPLVGSLTIEVMAQDAIAVLDHVGIDKAHVVGHSMGGVIAQQVAVLAPQRVRSLSLMCTFACGQDAVRFSWRMAKTFIASRIGSRTSRARAALSMSLSEQTVAERDIDELCDMMTPIIGRHPAEQPPILLKQATCMGKSDLSAAHRTIRCPTWVVSARDDWIAPTDTGRRLAEQIPSATFSLVEGAHAVTVEAPARINVPLRNFLDGHVA